VVVEEESTDELAASVLSILVDEEVRVKLDALYFAAFMNGEQAVFDEIADLLQGDKLPLDYKVRSVSSLASFKRVVHF
jgi:hypothetical protein